MTICWTVNDTLSKPERAGDSVSWAESWPPPLPLFDSACEALVTVFAALTTPIFGEMAFAGPRPQVVPS